YGPDLVVLGFVLNDVAAEGEAAGGRRRPTSRQVRLSVDSRLDWMANHSALVALARRIALSARFGRDVRLGAQRAELAEVRRLVESPERPEAQAGWEATRRDLERLTALCHERR